MKLVYSLTIISTFLFFVPIYAQFTDPFGYTGRLSATTQHINKGDNNSGVKWPKAIKYTTSNRRYDFDITLKDNTWYSEGGCGWNKAGRITFIRNTNVNVNKMHLGWQAIPNESNRIAVSLFFHNGPESDLNRDIDDNWVAHKFDTISTQSKTGIDMFLGHDIIALIVNNNAIGLRIKGWIPDTKRSFLMKTFYFGGSCGAPQYMEAYFEDQKYDWDGYGIKFNSQNSILWNMTEFESGDYFDYFALDKISGSIANEFDVEYNSNNPPPDRQKCIIHEGSKINFIAGRSVQLYPGFHVKNGAEFLAKTQPPPTISILTKPEILSGFSFFNVENVALIEYELFDSLSFSSESIFSGQVTPFDNLGVGFVDTSLYEHSYYMIATFYSGKGNQKKWEGWISNNNQFDINNTDVNITENITSYKSLGTHAYPNPTADIIKLKVKWPDNYLIKVYSASSKVILSLKMRIEDETSINLNGFSKGTYFLIISNDEIADIHILLIN